MRVFIRHRGKKRFLCLNGEWTADMRLARAFSTGDEATSLCRELGLQDVDLYYAFGETPSQFDFVAYRWLIALLQIPDALETVLPGVPW